MTMVLAEGYRPNTRLVALLFGGRVSFRVVVLGSNVVLAGHWGAAYAPYAGALGGSIFITSLAALGIEKAGLKMAPRDTERSSVISELATSALLLLVVALLVVGVRSFVDRGALLLLAGVYAALLGHNQVLVGLHRARGRPVVDPVNHAALSVGLVAVTTGAVLQSWRPESYLAAVAGMLAVADLALLITLHPGRTRGSRAARGGADGLLRTTGAMAVGDLIPGALVSVVFVLLDVTGREDQSSALYIATVGSSLLISAFGYLLRIWQPQLSLSLRDEADGAVRIRVKRHLRTLLTWGTPFLIGVTLVAGCVRAVLPDRLVATVLVQYALIIPIVFAMSSLNYLMENAAADDLSATAASACWSVVPALLLAVLLVAVLGAVGAVATLACAELLHGLLLQRRLGVGTAKGGPDALG